MPVSILVISDNSSFATFLTELLAEKGHKVSCCRHSDDLSKRVRATIPDLIITEVDAAGPASHGLEARLYSASGFQRVPVVVISDATRLEEELLNVFDVIPKPLDHKRLLDDIAAIAKGPTSAGSSETLGDREYHLFRDHLISLTGLHFELRSRASLKRGLLKRMAALRLGSFSAYYDYLKRHGQDRHELQKLLQFLTVGETHFFRYPAHFEALKKELAGKKEQRRFRLWSAGCSSGEEPYSIAITIIETFPDWRERDIRIFATDINNQSLKQARDGVYSPWSLRNLDPKYLAKYFDQVGQSFIVKKWLRELVHFSHQNLANLNYRDELDGELRDLDAIFCRNVMIYFTKEKSDQMVESFALALKPHGQLFLGHAETMWHATRAFESKRQADTFYYRKTTLTAAQSASFVASSPHHDASVTPRTTQQTLDRARVLYEAENFNGALRLLEEILKTEPQNSRALVLKGFILTHKGEFAGSLALCEKALSQNDLFADGYFLKGIIFDATDRLEEALSEYRKAILLDSTLIMPRFYMGKLYLRLGKNSETTREIKNSIRMLEKWDETATVPYSGGMTRAVCMISLQSALAKIS